MSIFSAGQMAPVGGGNRFAKLDEKGTTLYILAPSLAKVLSAPKYGVFIGSGGPMNASWIALGSKDVGVELGLKPQAKAFLWVWIPKNPKNLSEGGDVKIWECSNAHFQTIATQVTEFGQDLQGMMLHLQKNGNRWQLTANRPPASKALPQAVLNEAWQSVVDEKLDGSDEESFGKLVGVIPSPDLQRKFLIERSQGKLKTWNDVRKAFNLPPIDEDEDVESY